MDITHRVFYVEIDPVTLTHEQSYLLAELIKTFKLNNLQYGYVRNLTANQLDEIDRLMDLPNEKIDLSDAPELDWEALEEAGVVHSGRFVNSSVEE